MKFEKLSAKTINLRLVEPSDADFIYSLRNDELFNKHLSLTSGVVGDQKKWIEKYKEREAEGKEYYFIIQRLDNNHSIGTIRMYDFKDNPASFCWGSWILNKDKTNSAALESALLIYNLAFKSLSFEQSHFDVRVNNEKVIGFHKKMGAEIVSENDLDYFFIYRKDVFLSSMAKFNKFLVG
ncbi:GNAT family N-acetyltransferase [Erwinia sp. P7711]|uniref:GNAT family N-acetyltransferase n=1 Tax=Erwinia sp. P7711 TaxID=3141451 RepID=UPI003188B3C0